MRLLAVCCYWMAQMRSVMSSCWGAPAVKLVGGVDDAGEELLGGGGAGGLG